MKKYILIILAIILMINVHDIGAKEIFNKIEKGGESRVYVNFGFDPVFIAGAGYARSFDIKPINRVLTITADYSAPVFLFDLEHYKLDVGTRIAFFKGSWNIINRFRVINKGTDNPVFFGNLFSIEEGLLFGYFSDRWYAAGEFSYEKFMLTYIKHSNWYKKYVYEDAQDGWYSSTGGKLIFSLEGGYTFSDVYELTLRAGMYMTEGGNLPVPYGMPPFVADLGFSYKL